MDSFQILQPASCRTLLGGANHSSRVPCADRHSHSSGLAACHRVRLRSEVDPHGHPSGAIALDGAHSVELVHALVLHRVPGQRGRPWAPPRPRPLRRRGAHPDAQVRDPSLLRLTFLWFLPNPWVNAPFVYASLWSETVVAACTLKVWLPVSWLVETAAP